jgi:hypothetical protein
VGADVLLGSSVDAGTMAAERAILAEVLGMRSILLNFLAGALLRPQRLLTPEVR